MRILNVNMSLDPIRGGGTAERTFQISRALTKKELQCDLLTTNTNLTNECIESLSGVNLVALECMINRFYIPKFSQKIIREIVASADIIHLMNHWTILNAMVYFSAMKQRKPYVVCPAGALPIYGRSKIQKRIYNTLIGNRIISNASGHIAIGTNEFGHYNDYGIDPDKVSLIPNGINPRDFKGSNVDDFRRRYHLNNHPFILFVGRLNAIKGPDLLLNAFYRRNKVFKDYHLVFAGPDGGMLNELKNRTDEMGISNRVHFIGYIGGKDKSNAYLAANLLAIPSRQEAMSLVVLEAAIVGTPVLLTDQCGFRDVNRIGGGKEVPATVEAIEHGLIELLKNDDELRSKGKKLKKYIIDNYTWDNIINKYINLYDRILSR